MLSTIIEYLKSLFGQIPEEFEEVEDWYADV